MPVNDAKVRGWVFYDAECRFCVAGMRRWGGLFARRGFEWLPLQTPGAAGRLGVTEEQLLAEMWLQLDDSRVFSGVNSWGVLFRSVWWLWPLGVLLALPGLNPIAAWVYRWIARNRYCLGGTCKIHSHGRINFRLSYLLWLALFLAVVLFAGRGWPAWVLMWAVAFVLGEFTKWYAWRDARRLGCKTPLGMTLAWFLLWPGLDARAFFAPARPDTKILTLREWVAALIKVAVGVVLVWFVAPHWFGSNPLALGWVGMVGISLGLHFGVFHLLSLAWRAAGVNARHIMNRPLLATSLAEFWGERWNNGFNIPARRYLFIPIIRRFGAAWATVAVFMISGLMHELVISVPARGGFGLPFAYFLLQGVGVWLERTKAGRALGLGGGIAGWLFTVVLVAGPVFWLFHPPFVQNVILPMLDALGAR